MTELDNRSMLVIQPEGNLKHDDVICMPVALWLNSIVIGRARRNGRWRAMRALNGIFLLCVCSLLKTTI